MAHWGLLPKKKLCGSTSQSVIPDIRKSFDFLEISQAVSACPSDKSILQIRMNTGDYWSDTNRKTQFTTKHRVFYGRTRVSAVADRQLTAQEIAQP